MRGRKNLRAIYCEVEGGAAELVLLVHIEAVLSLCKVHQGKSSSIYLGSLMEEVDSSSGQEFSVCLNVIKNEVNQLLVSGKDSKIKSSIPTIRLFVLHKALTSFLVTFESVLNDVNQHFRVIETYGLQEIKFLIQDSNVCDLLVSHAEGNLAENPGIIFLNSFDKTFDVKSYFLRGGFLQVRNLTKKLVHADRVLHSNRE